MSLFTNKLRPGLPNYPAWVMEFNSVSDFADEMRAYAPVAASSFAGHESSADSLRLIKEGRKDWARLAEEVYEVLDTGGIELEAKEWGNERAGAFPVVPDYLAGIPEHMRRRLPNLSDKAPISIYADIACSGSFASANLVKRGAAILALCMALQQHRPVTPYLVCGLDAVAKGESMKGESMAQFITIKLDSSPMDLSQLSYLFGSAGFFRNLCFSFARKQHRFGGGWPWHGVPHEKRAIERARAVLHLEPQDLYIPGIYATDPIVENPIAWIENTLAQYKQHKDDES